MFYSNGTKGFYDKAIHGDNIPDDAVEITADEHAELLYAQSNGKCIKSGNDGKPVAVDPQRPTADQIWERIKADRDRRKDGGFHTAGKWFHSDPDSKLQHLGNKDTARDQLAAGGTMADPLIDQETGHQIAWKTMDGSWLPLTCQLAFDIVRAGKASEFAHHAAAEIHQAALVASADPASYDYSTGWPAIYEA